MFFGIPLHLWSVCLVVVIGRSIEMALCGIRTVCTVKGKPLISATVGFIEVFLWYNIVKAALDFETTNTLQTLTIALFYSLGFAIGTYLGCKLSSIFVKTRLDVQIVLSDKNEQLIEILKEKGYGQTILNARGSKSGEETYMIKLETDSKSIKEIKSLIDQYDPKAFVSIREVKEVVGGYFGNKK